MSAYVLVGNKRRRNWNAVRQSVVVSGILSLVVMMMVVMLIKVAADEVSLGPVMVVEAGFALLLILGPTPGLHLSVELARRVPPCTIRQIWASVTASLPRLLSVPAFLGSGAALAGAQLSAAGAVDLVATSTGSGANLLGRWNGGAALLARHSTPDPSTENRIRSKQHLEKHKFFSNSEG
jgi:hypothetical protein